MRQSPHANRPPVIERDQHPLTPIPARPSWVPLAASGAASALLISLMAALLIAHANQRTSPPTAAVTATTAGATVSATATPTGPQWQGLDSYTHVPGIVLAPSDTRTAYQSVLKTSKTAPTTLTLQRTHDAAATWQTVALPARLQPVAPDSYDGSPSFEVSPLNASIVYLTAAARLSSCPNTIGPSARAARLAAPLPSGPSCYTQYYSIDGAQTWHDLHLPLSGLLNGVQAQGTRLWAMISPPFVAQDTTAPAGRLTRSEDGGVTWHLADSGLPTSIGIADAAPAASGNTIFVVSDRADRFNSGVCQGCLAPPDFKLWRSDDAGAHWTQVTSLPYEDIAGLRVGSVAGAAQPALYLHVVMDTRGTGAVLASDDGGRSWKAVPAAGVEASTPQFQGLWGVLADGSALGVYAPSGEGKYTIHTFYAWKPGDIAWRPVAPHLTSPFLRSLLVGAPAGDGSQILTLLYEDQDGVRVATYQAHP